MAKTNYTALKKLLDLKPVDDDKNQQAALTHYLQGGDEEYLKMITEENTENYLSKISQLQKKPFKQAFQQSIVWDIPFPPTEKPKFTFIDLFAGI